MNLTDISLTADNDEFVNQQLAAGNFPTPSDVVNDALRQARIREAKRKLADLLLEGLNSGPGIEVTDGWRKDERAKFLAKLPPGTAE
jgi:putative addiction module CopG family antidote